NTLYAKVAARPALNDHLTKIITQLYIANTPWLPNENLCNHRRLGLPFWEIPTSTMSLTEMEAWNKDSYKNPQTIDLFVQRFKFPSSLASTDAAGYKQAVSLLKGQKDSHLTPLWWAIGGH
uniref:SusD/RagB family nutrient-binding outer membrane lipoprotein n=1 Tax=Prevotella sp. TaxID=59823 RepID=UPI003FF05ADE